MPVVWMSRCLDICLSYVFVSWHPVGQAVKLSCVWKDWHMYCGSTLGFGVRLREARDPIFFLMSFIQLIFSASIMFVIPLLFSSEDFYFKFWKCHTQVKSIFLSTKVEKKHAIIMEDPQIFNLHQKSFQRPHRLQKWRIMIFNTFSCSQMKIIILCNI